MLLALCASFGVPARTAAAAGTNTVEVLHLDGEVNAVSADYLSSALDQAGRDRVGAVVLMINTPGGLSTAMDQMVTALLGAPVPVAAYVAPAGARAASAGLFVSQAADVVAMAPGTNIGSAHPITGSGGDIGGDLGRKVLNDAVARVRSLATLHHRNADWCEQAVRDSVNIDADAAKQLGVADFEPPTMESLLSSLDGREAPRPNSRTLTFHTSDASLVDQPMSPFQGALQLLIDPNVAYILILVAVLGLIAEISSPGAILPGVVGGLAGILALVSLSMLPVNLVGLLLLGFAFLLFVVDVKAQTHGILTVGGLVSLLLGSVFLFNTGAVDLGVDWRLIVVAGLAAALGFAFVIRKAVRARSVWGAAPSSALIGSLGEARGALNPAGQVFVAGAIWPASAAPGTSITSGQTIRVIAQDQAALRVEPVGEGGSRSSSGPDTQPARDAASHADPEPGPEPAGAQGTAANITPVRDPTVAPARGASPTEASGGTPTAEPGGAMGTLASSEANSPAAGAMVAGQAGRATNAPGPTAEPAPAATGQLAPGATRPSAPVAAGAAASAATATPTPGAHDTPAPGATAAAALASNQPPTPGATPTPPGAAAAPASAATATSAPGATSLLAPGATAAPARGTTDPAALASTESRTPGATSTRTPGATATPAPGAPAAPAPGSTAMSAPDATGTLAAGVTTTPAPGPNATSAPSSTATPAPGAIATPAPGAIATPAPGAIATPAPGAIATPAPDAVATPAPGAIATPAPGSTATPAPSAVATPAPGAIATPVPGSTATPVPDATGTLVAGPTAAPAPGPTAAPAPGPTAAPAPGSTATPAPGASPPQAPGRAAVAGADAAGM